MYRLSKELKDAKNTVFNLFLLSWINAAAQNAPLDLSASHYEIGHTLLEYEDPSANMTLSQIVKLPATQFSSVTKAVPSHGFTQSAFWYRFEVENKKDTPLTRLIVFEPSWLDHVDVSVVSASGKMRSYEGEMRLSMHTERLIII